MLELVLFLLFMLTIGMVLAVIFIVTGVFTKKYWLEVIGRMCFYVSFLIVAIFGEFYMIGALRYPLIFGDAYILGSVWFPIIVFAVGFFLVLFEIVNLFEPKSERNKKAITRLTDSIKAQEKRLEDDKKELEILKTQS